jgi:hypothetical protein
MAGFAAVFAGRATGYGFLGVSGDHVRLEVVLMAALTDFHPYGPIASSCILRRQAPIEEKKNGKNGKDDDKSSHQNPLFRSSHIYLSGNSVNPSSRRNL